METNHIRSVWSDVLKHIPCWLIVNSCCSVYFIYGFWDGVVINFLAFSGVDREMSGVGVTDEASVVYEFSVGLGSTVEEILIRPSVS